MKALEALNKALEIDETLARAHALLGDLRRSFHYDWQSAEASYRRSIELNPNDWYSHITYAVFLVNQHRSEEAISEATFAQRLAPNDPLVRSYVANVKFSVFRDLDQYIAELRSLTDTEQAAFPMHWVDLGTAYLGKELDDDALAALQKAREMSDDNRTLATLGYAYGVVGKTREAREILDELLERSKQEPVSSVELAMICVGLGDFDRAVSLLEKAYDARSPRLWGLNGTFEFNPLRSHPRFQALLKKMNFPE